MVDSAAERALVAKMATFRHDPLGYVLYAFPWERPGTELADKTGPRRWQRKKLERIGKKLRAGRINGYEAIREATVSGHGSGKSAVVAWLTKWALDTLVNTKVVVTANTEKQLQTKTWPELSKWHNLSITRHWFTFTATSLYSVDPKAEKEWRADAIPWSENNTEAFAGLHNQGRRIVVIFDEASKIADKVWEVAEGALTDADTEILWCVFGNGTRATGRFRECFRRFKHRWEQEHIDSRQVEGTNKAQLDQWVADYGEDSDFVKIRVRGMFPAMSAKQFISETDVDAAFGRGVRADQIEGVAKILSVEPSWEGDDEFVIGFRQGILFEILGTYPKNDNDVQMANIVMGLEDEKEADAVFVDGGFGTGIISVGRTLNREWILVWFAERSADEGCINKRAEMWKSARDWLKEGGSIPEDQILHDELTAPEIVARLDGKLQLESKKDMKARGVPSPNRADALVLTFAHPVLPRRGAFGNRGKMRSDYDPMAPDGAGKTAVAEWWAA
jgi:hypothetical protein